jgi:hypothetical protein
MAFLQFPQILVMRWSLTDFSRHNIQAKARMIFSPRLYHRREPQVTPDTFCVSHA